MTCDLTKPRFTNEAAAVAFMEADRWPNGVTCPLCGCDNVHKMGGETQTGMFVCNDCHGKFTVRTGTVFERSHIPLHKWLLAMHLMASSKKGIAAHQLHRMLGITYKSAWFMAHRIREAMGPGAKASKLGGEGKVVEADTTYIGGKEKNKHAWKRNPKNIGGVGKLTVHTLVERGGAVRSDRVHAVNGETLGPILKAHADFQSALILTSQARDHGLLLPCKRATFTPLFERVRFQIFKSFSRWRRRRKPRRTHPERCGRQAPDLSTDGSLT